MNKGSVSKKIILGYWDGKPIWRYETSEERLFQALEDNKRSKLKVKEEQMYGHTK